MADADVIPLGARGRPGRGGNRSRTPSSAARSLATGPRSGARRRAGDTGDAGDAAPAGPPADRADTADPADATGPGGAADGAGVTSDTTTGPGGATTPASADAAGADEPSRRASRTGEDASRAKRAAPKAKPSSATGAKTAKRAAKPARAGAAGSTEPTRPDPAPGSDAAGTGTGRSAARRATSGPGPRRTAPATPSPEQASPAAATDGPAAPGQEVFVQRRGGRVGFDLAAAIGNAAHEVFGDDWEAGLAEFLAFLRRRVTGDYAVDEFGFDPDLTSRLAMATIRPLVERWFRVDVQGIENIPADGGALVVANHSGTIPLDGLVTGLVVHDHAERYLRMLGADLVFRLPFIGEMARKSGATLACNEDAERMLGNGELVGVWPEGFKGVGKPFSERYTLQRFGRGGFVSAALHTRVPIVPCSIVGAEEIYPLVGNLPTLARLIGVPYIPITPFFPWLGPLGMIPLPSKWIIEFGEPIRTDALTDEQAEDPMIVFNLTDQVRETIQQTLYALLMQRRNVFF